MLWRQLLRILDGRWKATGVRFLDFLGHLAGMKVGKALEGASIRSVSVFTMFSCSRRFIANM